MTLTEAGKVYSKKNGNKLKEAYHALKSALAEHFLDLEDDADVKEAVSWSLSDTATALGRELAEQTPNAYILDIFPDEHLIVYQVSWRGGYYQCSYTVDSTGVATFGTPQEVSRKVNYIPTSDNDPQPAMNTMSMESATIEIETGAIELIERAVNASGVTMLKLISPGIGSSGYYSEEVLKRDGPNVFTKGLHNLIDHPTIQEAQARPEGSIEKLGSTLLENAKWRDNYIDSKGTDWGKGLYAKAQVVPDFAEKLNTIAANIGTSIRASGKARVGIIDGKEMPIIESIEVAKSVDYVTLPGRGGKVIELMESANVGEVDMAISEAEFNEVKTQNHNLVMVVESLRADLNRSAANNLVEKGLTAYPTLPAATKNKIAATLATVVLPLSESGTLDVIKFTTMIKDEVSAETSYLASIGIGQVRGLGGVSAIAESVALTPEQAYKEYEEAIKDI